MQKDIGTCCPCFQIKKDKNMRKTFVDIFSDLYKLHSFPSSFFSCSIIYQTFINECRFLVLARNVYIANQNFKLVPLLSSVFCYLLHFLGNQAKA